jgi:VWFA-related protein
MLCAVRTSLSLVAAIGVMADGRAAARPEQKSALVTVIADAGTPIRNLTAADFIVKEGGKKLDIVEARLATDPLSVALLLDTAQPPRGVSASAQGTRAAATAFVKSIHAVNPDARIALWQVASAAAVAVDFTNKADDLENAIARLYPSQQTGAVLLEAVEAAGKQLAGRPGPRRAMVTVDFNSPEGSTDRMVQQSADSITNSGATLWAVSITGNAAMNPNRQQVLDNMTKATGGKRFTSVDGSGLEGMLMKVAASLTSQYIVTFTRPGEGPAKPTTFETVGGAKVLPTPFMR